MAISKKSGNITACGSNWAVQYVYDENRVCCELREVFPNGDRGAGTPNASGWGDNESQAMADAVDTLQKTLSGYFENRR